MKEPTEAQSSEQRVRELEAHIEELQAQRRLLVKTEHRLAQLRADSERQLEQIGIASDLATNLLDATTAHQAFELVVDQIVKFSAIEQMLFVSRTGSQIECTSVPDLPIAEVDAAIPEVMDSFGDSASLIRVDVLESEIVESASIQEQFLACVQQQTQIGSSRYPQIAVFIPIHTDEEDYSCGIVARCVRADRTPYFRKVPDEGDIPVFNLVAAHLGHAIRNLRLMEHIKERNELLETTNTQLENSLRELESTQLQLLQTSRMEAIGQLAGGVAHDFNNMLTVILNYAHLLTEMVEQEDASAFIADIIDAGTRASQLTNQLLAFSRRQPFAPEKVLLFDVITGMANMLRRLIGEDITLTLEPGEEMPLIRADRTQVEQVLLNLVVNARDAVTSEGAIIVRLRRMERRDVLARGVTPVVDSDCFVVLEVSDNGSGMDHETQLKVFEPFFTTKEFGKGTGMGLATVYGIVQQHNATITIDSQLGEGTTFSIYFPGQPPTGMHEPIREEITPSLQASEVVLLAEDEPAIRRLIERLLTSSGYTVVSAQNGQEALAEADRLQEIDLLVTDVVMPKMNGAQLAEALKKRWSDLKVLYISGYTDDIINEHGLDDNARMLRKPFTPNTLYGTVREVLSASGEGSADRVPVEE